MLKILVVLLMIKSYAQINIFGWFRIYYIQIFSFNTGVTSSHYDYMKFSLCLWLSCVSLMDHFEDDYMREVDSLLDCTKNQTDPLLGSVK